MIPEPYKSQIGAVVRAAVLGLGILLGKAGVETAGVNVEEIIGGVLTVGSLAWSFWQKKRAAKAVDAALNLPAGSTHADLKNELRS